ncbi:hypothetical protein HHL16_06480 [Pseudoflavitalea sp. G-6-1-2]|uniref:tetratricopeptide repeat protein n=1 Tax=Pseudoflavitalea sp. G-6-1-2 TaxID=2728841 RepID=UPI00146A5327|nr:hypothetical protein [Pseudoflavitalea sp. G-6-1-2]NML20511.1 hypothetical protein [Pseudoflavitalea sp. G-6-1-2]
MRWLVMIIITSVGCPFTQAQSFNTQELISIMASDHAGHAQEEVAKIPVSGSSEPFLFDTLLPAAIAYQQKHPSRILQIHILRLQANAASNYRNFDPVRRIQPASIICLEEAVRLCYEEKNDVLLAEVFFDLAELYNLYGRFEEYMIMLSRAFDISSRLEAGTFPLSLRYNKYGGMCKAAYYLHSYAEAIQYGRLALASKPSSGDTENDIGEIYLLDLIGASHKKLNQPDSSISCYEQLLAKLPPFTNRRDFHVLWTAIANGNIGENKVYKGDYAAAQPMLDQWLQSALEFRDDFNASLARNALAALDFHTKRFDAALESWKQNFRWAVNVRNNEYAFNAAKGMAEIYRLKKIPDSAYHYLEQAALFNDSLQSFISQSGLQSVKANVKLDELQYSLEKSTLLLREEKQQKLQILVTVALLAIIGLLLYNRKRLQMRSKLQQTRERQLAAERETNEARNQVDEFIQRLKEKNDLIESLKLNLTAAESLKERQDIYDHLSSYTLMTDTEWIIFKDRFTRVHPSFFSNIATRFSKITPSEERMVTLIFLGLNKLQISNALGISPDSVTRSRHRLRQKLGLAKDDSLEEIILSC